MCWDFESGLMSAGRGLGFLQEKGLQGRVSAGKLRVGEGGGGLVDQPRFSPLRIERENEGCGVETSE